MWCQYLGNGSIQPALMPLARAASMEYEAMMLAGAAVRQATSRHFPVYVWGLQVSVLTSDHGEVRLPWKALVAGDFVKARAHVYSCTVIVQQSDGWQGWRLQQL